jgi:glycosyltransferase involved in cell wall biosynthesis
MAAKRILIFSFVYYPRFIGGAEIAIKEITDRLEPSDFEFDLIALRLDKKLPKKEKIGNVTVYRIGWAGSQTIGADSLPFVMHLNKFAYPFLAALKASHFHRRNPYNGIWAMMANYSGFGALFFKMFHMHVPFILTLQEGDPIDYIKSKVKFVYGLFGKIFTEANVIQTISNYLADFARDMNAKAPIEVIPNGVDIAHFSQAFAEAELNAIKTALGKKEGDLLLITTSRLVVKNAVGDIIKSLTHLPEHVRLAVLGTGYLERELKELSKKLGLESRITFLGYVSHAEMPKYLKASDIFIRPSLSEGFGNSFIEAMAAGIPVIATPVGGIVDFLKNKETGLFCDVGSPQDIARKVEIYTHDKNLREEIIDNAKAMVLAKYDWNMVAESMEERVFGIIRA